MAVEHAVFVQPLGAGGLHVLLADLVKKGVLGEHGEGGEVADHDGQGGQRDVVQVIQRLAPPGQLIEIVRSQPAQRKPLPVGAAGEQHHQQNGDQKAGDRIADDDRGAAPHVEAAAVAHRLFDAQRHRHQISDQRAPQPQGDGHRQAFGDQGADVLVAVVGFAEIEGQIAFDHQPETFRRRLVEAVELFDTLEQLRRHPP